MVKTDNTVCQKVQLRGGFSDRNNIDSIDKTMQYITLNDRTRVVLYNQISFFTSLLIQSERKKWGINEISGDVKLARFILKDIYLQLINYNNNQDLSFVIEKFVYNTIFQEDYDKVLTVIEAIENKIEEITGCGYVLQDTFNKIFEDEFVGYRFIEGKITPITDEIEITEVKEACNNKYAGCKSHLKKALGFLADREAKDFKNSIKESISAVESICAIIIGKDHATLGEALRVLESKNNLKGQLKSAFEKLYNYTNDKGGIRHAEGLFESEVTFEEAKFMLVSCSAFVNYLIAEFGKTIGK